MKRHLFLFFLCCGAVCSRGQETFYGTGFGYVLFGEGDHSGVNYYSQLQFPVFEQIGLKTGIQVANAAEAGEDRFYDRHNVFNLSNNLNIVITPIASETFRLSISAGGVWRYRAEIVYNRSQTVYTVSGKSLNMVVNDYTKTYDVGYNADVTALFKTTDRIYTGVSGQFAGYNKGSGLYTINLCLNYRL